MSATLPTGTVTFLFTDIAGSTETLARLGAERYAELLSEHRRLIRAAVAEHGGMEVDTQGDAFFCVFASARSAVACAEAAQARLADLGVRVRMGLHTGEALLAEGHYVGMEVHRAARLAASGHGGQVVLSASTVALLPRDSLTLRDLGEHRLKDLTAPERIYQLGEQRFPALKTLHRTNLPVPATPFVGRDEELRHVVAHLREAGCRLLTLTGPGGTGKTRLALQAAAEVADDFPGGVFWVPLAPLRDPALVASAFADALGVEERRTDDLARSVAAAVQAPTLLVVDNCEHVLDAVAAVVAGLLRSGGALRLVATSREPLALSGERVVPVDPLARGDAVALFQARAEAAGAADLDASAVDRLCARLDDLPLALELAAARAPVLPPEQLLERLSGRVGLLRGPRDAEARQQTLEATIRWSYDLLVREEQALLRRLAVFAGGGSLEAVEDVAEADVEALGSLVAKSLVRVTRTPSGPRYWLLETIREFAGGLLDAGDEADAVRDRHVGWFTGLAGEAAAHLRAPDAAAWFDRLETELGNLRSAFARSLAGDDESAVELGRILGELHLLRGRHAEARDVLTRAIERARDPVAGSALRSALGRVLVRRGEIDAAGRVYAEAEALLGPPGPDADDVHRRAWIDLKIDEAGYHYFRGDAGEQLDRASAALGPLIERHGTARQRAHFTRILLQSRYRRELYALSEETEAMARASVPIFEAAGDWDARFSLGFTLLWRGKFDEAESELQACGERAREVGDAVTEVRCLVYRTVARRRLGDVAGARRLDTELAELEETHGYDGLVAANRAWLAWREGDVEAAEREAARALASWEDRARSGPTVFQWSARFPLLAIEAARGNAAGAAAHADAMLDATQQPLAPDAQEALRTALRARTAEAFLEAAGVARALGYA